MLQFNSNELQLPEIVFHRKCYQLFTIKSSLERIERKEEELCELKEKNEQELQCTLRSCSYTSESAENRPKRTPNSNKILPDECVFCLKNSKYKNRTKKKLRFCCEFRSVTAIRTAAERKNNFQILGLLSKDLIAREGKYHYSSYVDFTRCNYTEKEKEVPQSSEDEKVYKEFELQAFQEVVKYCHSLITECPKVTKFHSLTRTMEDVLKNNNVTPKVSTKKNLRKNTENACSKKFIFVNIDRILYLYPNTLTTEKLVADFISMQSAMNEGENKVIVAAAIDIRKQIKQMQDEIHWPPEPQNLSTDQFKMAE